MRMPVGGTLALDPAGDTGWCYGDIHGNEPPHFGTWHLNKESEGSRYASFRNTLVAFLTAHLPDHVVQESTLNLPAMNNYFSAAQAFVLRGIIIEETWRGVELPNGKIHPISRSSIDCHTVRKEIMGVSRLRSKDKPREVVGFCRKVLKLPVVDHNAGDAVLTWMWHRARIREEPGSLWWRAAAD
jgi:hypothetical protein